MPAPAHTYDWLPPVPPRKFRLYPGEKAVMRARPERTASEWAEGNRHVAMSAMPGPLDLDVTPYMRGILDAFSSDWVQELFLAGGSQSAKTDIMHTCAGYAMEHDPGPGIIVMQDRATGTETVQERLIPMIRHTPSLRRLCTRNPDDLASSRIRLRNGAILYLAWSNSEGRVASKPIRYGFLDEVDLWPEATVRKVRARFRTFLAMRMAKIIEACTVSTSDGRIWSAQHEAQAIWDFYAVCPHCGHAQALSFAGLRWADGVVDPAELAERGSAWYECEECRRPWDEDDRNEAVRLGALDHDPPHSWYGWRPRPGKPETDRPSRIWIHIPPLLSRFVAFNDLAAAYLRQMRDPTAANVAYFYNDCCGLPVPDSADGVEVKEGELYKRREPYAPETATWQIPVAACFLTAAIDVQANRLECEVTAWGPGHEWWGVQYKVFHGKPQEVEVWDQAHDWLQETRWTHESGVSLAISGVAIDIGYCSDHVAKFVRRSRKYRAVKGSNTRGLPLTPRRPSKGKYKCSFYELGTDTGKDTIFTWLANEGAGPRVCHFPMTYDFDYFRMLCAEHPVREKDKKTGKMITVWKLRDGFQRNEALDIRVYNLAIRQILNPNYEKLAAYLQEQAKDITPQQQKKPSEAPAKEPDPKRPTPFRLRRGGFVNGWKK